jgi:hypothetical protein
MIRRAGDIIGYFPNANQKFYRTSINWLMPFKEIAVYCENHMKHINTLCGQNTELLIVKVSGTYGYHWVI